MDNLFFWAQIVGFVAMAIGVAAMQVKDSRKILLWNVPSGLLWTIQYMMLNAPIGALLNFISSLKDVGLVFITQQHVKNLIIAFLTLTWAFGLYNYAHWYDILPLVGITTLNVALMIDRDNRSLFVRAALINCVMWIIYNIIVGSWMGTACASSIIVSSMVSMARYEAWEIGRCHRTFLPSITRGLFKLPNFISFS